MARVVRGFFVAQVCLALSVGGHAVAGGSVHLTAPMLFAWLVLSVLCVAAARRRRGFIGIGSTVMASQIVLHVLMTTEHSQVEHGMHGASAPLPLVALVEPSARMVVGHVVAAALASVLLAYGEQLIWAVWTRCVLPRVPFALHPVLTHAPPVLVPTAVRAPDDGRLFAGGATRRGPPGR